MKGINKILALALTCFLLLAISGVNFQFHICGISHSLFADIHIAETADQNISCDFCKEANSCCSGNPESNGTNNTTNTSCIDFDESIDIDNSYNISQFHHSIQLTEIQLLSFSVNPFMTELPPKGLYILNIILSPPEPEMTSVFLL